MRIKIPELQKIKYICNSIIKSNDMTNDVDWA